MIYWYIKSNGIKSKNQNRLWWFNAFLVSILTLGIYAIVWQYKAGKRLAMQGASDLSIIYLIFVFISLSWLNPFLMQHQANKLKNEKNPRFG